MRDSVSNVQQSIPTYPIPINKGGTGATTATQAKSNLGIGKILKLTDFVNSGEVFMPDYGSVMIKFIVDDDYDEHEYGLEINNTGTLRWWTGGSGGISRKWYKVTGVRDN